MVAVSGADGCCDVAGQGLPRRVMEDNAVEVIREILSGRQGDSCHCWRAGTAREGMACLPVERQWACTPVAIWDSVAWISVATPASCATFG